MVEMKNYIEVKDIAKVVEDAVSLVIFKRSDGTTAYMPYFIENAVKVSILANLAENIDIDDEDGVIDDYLNITNSEYADAVNKFITDKEDETDEIYRYVYDIVDFRKNEYASQNSIVNERIIKATEKENALTEILTSIANKQNEMLARQAKENERQLSIMENLSAEEILAIEKKFANGEMNMEAIAEKILKDYVKTDSSREENLKKVIDEKNKTILDLQRYKALHEARNVLEDDGK